MGDLSNIKNRNQFKRSSQLPTELTSQLGAGQYVGSKETIQVMNNDFRCMKFIYLHCGQETSLRDPRSLEHH